MIIPVACLVGLIGDATLQYIVKNTSWGGTSGWGLNSYFTQHGRVEGLFIAAGMLTVFFILYDQTGLPWTYLNLALYGILLDWCFRTFRIFPSLDGYYQHMNYVWSAVWGAIPMCLPLFIVNNICR